MKKLAIYFSWESIQAFLYTNFTGQKSIPPSNLEKKTNSKSETKLTTEPDRFAQELSLVDESQSLGSVHHHLFPLHWPVGEHMSGNVQGRQLWLKHERVALPIDKKQTQVDLWMPCQRNDSKQGEEKKKGEREGIVKERTEEE